MASDDRQNPRGEGAPDSSNGPSLPAVSIPTGGGAIRGIGEKFGANPVVGQRVEDRTTQPGFVVHPYRPRVESSFARIERWTSATGDVRWRSIAHDNVTTWFGTSANSRIADPDDAGRVFAWLIAESYDQ